MREADGLSKPVQPGATAAVRFGFERPGAPPQEDLPPLLEWDTPEGWRRADDRPMRLATFTAGQDGVIECYVSVFPDSAGGLVANLGRWYAQMGQEPPPATAIAELPTVTILDQPAPMAAVTGEFTGTDGKAQPGYMLLGVICELPTSSVFVKLVGPEAEVRNEQERFVTFCESLRPPEVAPQ